MAQVLDSLITSLTKHTQLLNPAQPQASVAFGADELSCMATETMFELGNRHCSTPAAPCLISCMQDDCSMADKAMLTLSLSQTHQVDAWAHPSHASSLSDPRESGLTY